MLCGTDMSRWALRPTHQLSEPDPVGLTHPLHAIPLQDKVTGPTSPKHSTGGLRRPCCGWQKRAVTPLVPFCPPFVLWGARSKSLGKQARFEGHTHTKSPGSHEAAMNSLGEREVSPVHLLTQCPL